MSIPSSPRRTIERTPMLPLLIVPIAIIIISTCTADPSWEKFFCFFSAFFADCLLTQVDIAFIATFLSFVAALLTATCVESSRLCNQPSRIITTPAVTWLLVNLFTGALVTPMLLIATVRRTNHRINEQREFKAHGRLLQHGLSTTPESTAIAAKNYSIQRHLIDIQETYAIPIGVTLGYIAPSIALLMSPSYAIVGLWNLFPIYISNVRRAILSYSSRPRSRTTHDAEHSTTSLYRLYTIPVLLSVLAQVFLVYSCFAAREAESLAKPALKLMLVNFCAIAATFIYWLLIESSWRTAFAATITSLVLGPGSGLSLGWILKETSIALPEPNSATPDGASQDGMGESEPLIRDAVPKKMNRA
ncbi:hypothetical protein BDR22DRAFT_969388 [Usnea florida]